MKLWGSSEKKKEEIVPSANAPAVRPHADTVTVIQDRVDPNIEYILLKNRKHDDKDHRGVAYNRETQEVVAFISTDTVAELAKRGLKKDITEKDVGLQENIVLRTYKQHAHAQDLIEYNREEQTVGLTQGGWDKAIRLGAEHVDSRVIDVLDHELKQAAENKYKPRPIIASVGR